MNKNIISAGLLALLLTGKPAAAQQAGYDIIDLGTLGGNTSTAFGINNLGQIVGSSYTSDGRLRPFLYSNGVMQNLGSLATITLPANKDSGIARSINDAGQIVGFTQDNAGDQAFVYSNGTMQSLHNGGVAYSINTSGQIAGFVVPPYRAFLYQNGQTTYLGTLGGASSAASAINSSGQITGFSDTINTTGPFQSHAFLYQSGVMQDIGKDIPLNGTEGHGLNDSGMVVGGGFDPNNINGLQAFLWQNGQATLLGTLGGRESSAYAISKFGVVTGAADLPNNVFSAFAYQNGQMYDVFAGSDWFDGIGRAINDRGQIVGDGVHNGGFHAFLATPRIAATPAPSSLLVVLAGGGMLAVRLRRRRSG